MNYYIKLIIAALAICVINLFLCFCLFQIQIIHNSGYLPVEVIPLGLIIIAIPVQFIILLIVGALFKRKRSAILITSIIIIIISFLLMWFSSSEGRGRFRKELTYNQMEKYDWEQGISVPEGYPVKLTYDSRFVIPVRGDKNPVTLLNTDDVYFGQWRLPKTTLKTSDEGGVVLPDSLRLKWYSFVENKYYQLNVKLDKNKISNYFKTGFKWDISGNGSQIIDETYNSLTAGLAPGGDVIVWISGINHTKEIGAFKAREITKNVLHDYDIITDEKRNEVLNDTTYIPKQFKTENKNKSIPYGIWINKYRKKYNWKCTINIDKKIENQSLDFNFFNAEAYVLYKDEIAKSNYDKQVLPAFFVYSFKNNQKRYKAFFDFDEEEVYRHFETIAQNNPDEPIDLVININSELSKVSIQLKTKTKVLDFVKMKEVEIRQR